MREKSRKHFPDALDADKTAGEKKPVSQGYGRTGLLLPRCAYGNG